ncbi:MAG: FAD-binding oxidoreductase [Acidobacteria bacterium]|nr:FAD-binding oxidoreductase [Acidobacteriota bacterium]MBI3488631.1 FAD-binding oxidoreductase [Acidobacteriota bacterium]
MAPDVLIVGGGIVGGACALALARQGCRVGLLEAEGWGLGATGAAMGHLVALDGSPEELALCRLGLERWKELAPELGAALDMTTCGTLWVAADDEEMELVRPRCETYRAAGIRAELLDAAALRGLEPCLATGLAGGMLVPGDAVVYPPAGARLLAEAAARAGAELLCGRRVASLEPEGLRLDDGTRLPAGRVVIAAGSDSKRLLPDLPLVKRKGHLAITDRRPGFLRHQLVELGYLKSAHASREDSVAFNLQPRPNGQLLLGSSRQFGDESPDLRPHLLQRMIRRALAYVPGLAEVPVLRAWTGFRPTTPDHRPLIGPWPHRPGVFLACGHEGLGITTAPATAELLTAWILGQAPPLDPAPYLPSRFPEVARA